MTERGKYCEDVDCPNLEGDCKLGFKNTLQTPRSIENAVKVNWGHIMPKVCRAKFRKANTVPKK